MSPEQKEQIAILQRQTSVLGITSEADIMAKRMECVCPVCDTYVNPETGEHDPEYQPLGEIHKDFVPTASHCYEHINDIYKRHSETRGSKIIRKTLAEAVA